VGLQLHCTLTEDGVHLQRWLLFVAKCIRVKRVNNTTQNFSLKLMLFPSNFEGAISLKSFTKMQRNSFRANSNLRLQGDLGLGLGLLKLLENGEEARQKRQKRVGC
jgi:hypothetical protein